MRGSEILRPKRPSKSSVACFELRHEHLTLIADAVNAALVVRRARSRAGVGEVGVTVAAEVAFEHPRDVEEREFDRTADGERRRRRIAGAQLVVHLGVIQVIADDEACRTSKPDARASR